MPIQDINTGAQANDGTGTPARSAGQIINANFEYILQNIKLKINGLYVEKYPGNTDEAAFEVNDKFDGWIGNDRFVAGIVLDASADLPADIDDDTKVKLIANNYV